jgi:hypothetical protein
VGGTDPNTRVNSAGTALVGHTVVARDRNRAARADGVPGRRVRDLAQQQGRFVGHGYDTTTRLAEPLIWPATVRPVAIADDGVTAAEAWYDNAHRRTC